MSGNKNCNSVSDTRKCVTLYKVISRILKSKKTASIKKNNWFKTAFLAILILLIFISFIFDYFSNQICYISQAHIYYPLLVFFINFLLSITIIIYIFISRSVDRRIEGVINAFRNNEGYENNCRYMYTWLDLRFRNFCIEPCNMIFKLISKILYAIVWLLGIIFIVWYSIEYTSLCDSYSGFIVVFLFVISSLMQGYSFFYSFVYIRFLHKLSQNSNREDLEKYEYNSFLPSQSSGYKQLMSNINFNSTCFIIESLLFVVVFILLLFVSNKTVDILMNIEDLVFYSIYILLCVVGSLAVYMVPKYMMKRILTVWIDKSRKDFESRLKKLIKKTNQSEDEKTIRALEKRKEIVINDIANLQKDSFVFNGDYINLVLVALTLIITIIPIIINLINE